MQEYTSPGEVAIDPSENLTRALWAAADQRPDAPAVAHRVGDRFVEWSNRQFADEILSVAKGLIAKGIQPGDKVCLYSATRIEWTVFDIAIWTAGAVTVPIYETSSAEQVEWIVSDSEAKAIVIETPELKGTFASVAGKLPTCEHAFVIEEGAVEDLKQAGASISDEDARRTA
ncbi:MAG: AMP-binding protein, partial [Nitriliruptor sp.]